VGTAPIRDGGLWLDGDYTGNAHLASSGATSASSTDLLHPSLTNTSGSGFGGVYILSDYVASRISAMI